MTRLPEQGAALIIQLNKANEKNQRLGRRFSVCQGAYPDPEGDVWFDDMGDGLLLIIEAKFGEVNIVNC
jgi:hypothetical protein